MACSGRTWTIPEMWDLAGAAGFSGPGQIEIVAHALVESGGCDRAYNSGSQAAGILQFIPSTAAGVGLSNPFDAAASFRAAYKLTGGTNFRDWTPYEPAAALAAALAKVKDWLAQTGKSVAGAALPGGTGLLHGLQPDSWGIGQSIADAAGTVGATLKIGGQQTLNAGQVLAGLLVMGAGVGLLGWLLLRDTSTGRGAVKAAGVAKRAAAATAKAAAVVA